MKVIASLRQQVQEIHRVAKGQIKNLNAVLAIELNMETFWHSIRSINNTNPSDGPNDRQHSDLGQ